MMPLHHGWGWYPPQTASHILIIHIQCVWGIGMLSQGHMDASLHQYTSKVSLRILELGSHVEWQWCHYMMVEAEGWHPPHIASHIHIRHIWSVWGIVLLSQGHIGCSLIPLHLLSWPHIWNFGSLVEWKWLYPGWGWYPPQTGSHIHIRHIKDFEPLFCCLKGLWVHRYTVTQAKLGPRFWNFGSLVEWKWCHYIMVEANVHLRLLPTSILDI